MKDKWRQWRWTVTAIFLISLLLLMSGCMSSGSSREADDLDRRELFLAIGGEPQDGFDPTTGWGRYGSPLFQSTLFKRNADFEIENDLALGYDISEDRKRWTIPLREDVVFSDGEPLTAADVVFTYKQAAESGSVIDLNHVQQIEAVGDFTVEFTLKEPRSTFIQTLVSTGIVPKHAYNDQYREHPVGSGPFQLVQWDKGQQLIVEANPLYYGEKPFFTKLNFLFLAEDTAFAAAQAGQVDVVAVPPSFAGQDVPGMQVRSLESVDNRGVMFPYVPAGTQTKSGHPIGHDVTADRAIRQAINIAIDRQELVDGVLDGYGTPAYSVSDQLPWWNPETVIADGDLPRAENVLEQAGWQKAADGIYEKDGLRAAFTLIYPAGDQVRHDLSLGFADRIKMLGIEVTVAGKSWDEVETLMHSHPVMMGWGSHDPLEMYHIYSSETRGIGYYNANYYTNETVDQYMEQAMRAAKESAAITYWKKAQWDGETGFSARGDAPWAWLVNLNHVYFVRENLNIGKQKVQPHGHGWPITDTIEQWKWDY